MASTFQATSRPAAAFGQAGPAEVQQWLRSGEAVLVDVREPDEHAREHIEQATLLPLSRFDAAQAAALARPGQKLVVHCKSGGRSADACRMTAAAAPGVEVLSMTGGIEAWKRSNLPTRVDAGVSAISVLRQMQLVVGLSVLTGSALAYFVHPAFLAIPAFFGAGLTFAGASGTCMLMSLLRMLPWNRASCARC
jgi:rhodanese-related sulfurtransferase